MQIDYPMVHSPSNRTVDPILIDELMEEMAEHPGEVVKWGVIAENFPGLEQQINEMQMDDHDFSQDLYIDITNKYKITNPTGPNIDEKYTVLRDKDGKTIVFDDITYKARPYTFGEELFGGEMVDKSLKLRGKTRYEKYEDKTKKFLGIKRKQYHVYENPEGKLEQELDKDVVYLRTPAGRLYVKGEDPPQDYYSGTRDMFDD